MNQSYEERVRLDLMCQCGHEYELHQTPGTECAVLDCRCGTFRDGSGNDRHSRKAAMMGTALDVGYCRVPCERDDGSMYEVHVRKGRNTPEIESYLEALEKATDEVLSRMTGTAERRR